ncbi:MAG TPA: response regulator [Candidatus Acidoferrum sp.]|jgi:CheY-like chemotaxis protein
MTPTARVPKILLIDSNVYFSKRLSDALKKEGFQVLASTQPEFALTTLEYDTPTAVVCATNMRGMGALEIASIIHADAKNAALPIIALGDGSQRALMEAFQAGCDDYIDRQRQPAVIAAHIRNIIISKAEGFQPTQMLAQADTSLSGSLTHHDLPGVLQMLGHAHQTGALHINAGATDAVLFFDAGNITHAECGSLFGDEAVIHIVKSCIQGGEGVYKFVYGASTPRHTVLRSATDLMLDAMREYDESSNSVGDSAETKAKAVLDDLLGVNPPINEAPQAEASEYESPAISRDVFEAAPQQQESNSFQTAPDPVHEVPAGSKDDAEIRNEQPSNESSEPPIEYHADQHVEPVEREESLIPQEDFGPAQQLEPSTNSDQPSVEGSAAGTPSLEDDSVSGYTETSPVTEQENTTTDIVPMPQEQEEEISLLEKILMELAARHIVEETPADLADKEAQ